MSSIPVDGPPEAEALKPARGARTSVRTMLALVACCGALAWSWKAVRDASDPALMEARAIQNRGIAALRSPGAADRLTAIQELERLGFGDASVALGPLIAVLRDDDPEIRRAAAGALGRLGLEAIRAGGSDRAAIRASATALVGSLKDDRPEVRITAAQALGAIATTMLLPVRGRPPAGPAWTTPIDRAAAVAGLAGALGDRDPEVRHAARTALATIGRSVPIDPPRALAAGLEDPAPETRRATAAALAGFRRGLDPWVPVLLRLAEDDPDPEVRASCMGELGRIPRSAMTEAGVSALARGLESRRPRVRIVVASLLGRLGPGADAVAALPALIRVLHEPLDPEVARRHEPPHDAEAGRRPGLWMLDDDPACAAADALARIGPGSRARTQVIDALIEVVRAGPRLRHGWAAHALGRFGPAAEKAVPSLVRIIEETSPSVGDRYNEESAAIALGQIAPETPSADRAVAALTGMLSSPSRASRSAALRALRPFGPQAAASLPRLRTLQTSDPDADIRGGAAETLRAIEPPRVPPAPAR